MVWMNQNQIAELFDTSKQNIRQHIAVARFPLKYTRCDCKKSFSQSQESGDRGQKSPVKSLRELQGVISGQAVKTKSYGFGLLLNYSYPDFLQAHLGGEKYLAG